MPSLPSLPSSPPRRTHAGYLSSSPSLSQPYLLTTAQLPTSPVTVLDRSSLHTITVLPNHLLSLLRSTPSLEPASSSSASAQGRSAPRTIVRLKPERQPAVSAVLPPPTSALVTEGPFEGLEGEVMGLDARGLVSLKIDGGAVKEIDFKSLAGLGYGPHKRKKGRSPKFPQKKRRKGLWSSGSVVETALQRLEDEFSVDGRDGGGRERGVWVDEIKGKRK